LATSARVEAVAFITNPAANPIVATGPFAFFRALLFDQGILAERAW